MQASSKSALSRVAQAAARRNGRGEAAAAALPGARPEHATGACGWIQLARGGAGANSLRREAALRLIEALVRGGSRPRTERAADVPECVCVSGGSGANQEPARPGPRRHLDRRISVARLARALAETLSAARARTTVLLRRPECWECDPAPAVLQVLGVRPSTCSRAGRMPLP